MNLYEDKEGGLVVVKNLTWIGPVRPVKVSSGKGKDLVEKTVYNFLLKSGFQTFLSVDYHDEDVAKNERDQIIGKLA